MTDYRGIDVVVMGFTVLFWGGTIVLYIGIRLLIDKVGQLITVVTKHNKSRRLPKKQSR